MTHAGKNRDRVVARSGSLPVRGCARRGAGQHRILPGGPRYAFPDSVDASASGIDRELELKGAFVFGGALGYRFPWVRLELNGSYRKFDTDKVKTQGQSVSGNGDATAAVGLFNVYSCARRPA